jgi:GT2 family glycosyltransferase
MNIKVTGCIVMYNNDKNMLEKCITSFLNTEVKVTLDLIDNSPNTNLAYLQHLDDRISYFSNPSNPGFGASHNISIARAIEYSSDYHLILNPDIYYNTDVLKELTSFMDNNNEVGHIMPKITYPNGDYQYLCKRNPTFFDMFIRGFSPRFIKNYLKGKMEKFEYRDHDYNKEIYDIPYLSGCFMLFRITTLKKVGFFDDSFFMYLEDADITRRFLQISRTLYYPKVQVFHHFAKFTHSSLKFKFITIQSAFTYFKKWGFTKHIF